MSKHTPGPWKLLGPKKHKDNDGIESIDYAVECIPGGPNTGSIIAEVFHRTGKNIFHDSEANARLIAAAPDMFEALKNYACPRCDGSDLEFPCADTTACRAIKKAEGII